MEREPIDEAPRAAIFRVRGLRKRYGSVQVLGGLDLTPREGEVYGLLGRNGAGKTTTLRILMGIIGSDGGTLELFGEPVRRLGPRQKLHIGYVSQEQHFYAWMTCRGLGRFVAGFYPSWDQALFDDLLRRWDIPPKRRTGQLSHGMRVKLALALALAHRPRLLLLDEPTAGLDPAARRELLEIVRREATGLTSTTVFSSHIVEEIERVSDRIGVLDRGRLVYEGEASALKERMRRIPLALHEALAPLLGEGLRVLLRESSARGDSVIVEGTAEALGALPQEALGPLTLEDAFLALTTPERR